MLSRSPGRYSHLTEVILSTSVLQAERKPALSEAEGDLALIGTRVLII